MARDQIVPFVSEVAIQRPRRGGSLMQTANVLAQNQTVQRIARSAAKAAYDYAFSGKGSSNAGSNQKALLIEDIPIPISKGQQITRQGPRTQQMKNGAVRISNREVVTTSLSGSSSWTEQLHLEINPGISATFPWLSTIAAQYQEYRFRNLSFEFVPIVPTTTAGDIILTPNYDASVPSPSTEIIASDQIGTISGSCFLKHTCHLKPRMMHPNGPYKYVRSLAMAGDPKTYDVAQLTVSTVDQAGGSKIGKLFVSYTVDLVAPTLVQASFGVSNVTRYELFSDDTFVNATPKVLDPMTESHNPLRIVSTGTTYTAPLGNYRVDFCLSFKDTASESFAVVTEIGTTLHKSKLMSTTTSGGGGTDLIHSGTYIWENETSYPFSITCTLAGAAGTLTCTGLDTGMATSFLYFTLL